MERQGPASCKKTVVGRCRELKHQRQGVISVKSESEFARDHQSRVCVWSSHGSAGHDRCSIEEDIGIVRMALVISSLPRRVRPLHTPVVVFNQDHCNQVTSQQRSWRQRSKWIKSTWSHFVRSGYVNDSLYLSGLQWVRYVLVTVDEGFIGNWQRFTPHKMLTYGCCDANSDVIRCFYPIAS